MAAVLRGTCRTAQGRGRDRGEQGARRMQKRARGALYWSRAPSFEGGAAGGGTFLRPARACSCSAALRSERPAPPFACFSANTSSYRAHTHMLAPQNRASQNCAPERGGSRPQNAVFHRGVGATCGGGCIPHEAGRGPGVWPARAAARVPGSRSHHRRGAQESARARPARLARGARGRGGNAARRQFRSPRQVLRVPLARSA
ncbi:MAG: hypothetical protein J3K34DRAFT_441909 [Monoraphidium minutum]|nr:MAG: hypothetical protein J3K34DRAFT_441909 [Monoraphidium minutum]